MPRQTATRSTSRQVKMTVLGPNGPRTTTAGLLRIRQDRLDTERELDLQAQRVYLFFYNLIVLFIFTPTEQRAAILPVEAALEVGFEPTSHHDSEYLTAPYLDHSEPVHYDSEWSSDDSNSSIEDEATPTSSRPSINVYSAYSRLQQRTQ